MSDPLIPGRRYKIWQLGIPGFNTEDKWAYTGTYTEDRFNPDGRRFHRFANIKRRDGRPANIGPADDPRATFITASSIANSHVKVKETSHDPIGGRRTRTRRSRTHKKRGTRRH